MTTDELNKKVEGLRVVSETKMKYLRNHSKLLDQAFEELKEEAELDLIYGKLQELEKRMDQNGFS